MIYGQIGHCDALCSLDKEELRDRHVLKAQTATKNKSFLSLENWREKVHFGASALRRNGKLYRISQKINDA